MQKNPSSTNYRLQLRQRILEASMREFLARGIAAVRMDDISHVLSISKRTLYEIYTNKEELLMECVQENSKRFTEHMTAYCKEHSNVMDILLEFHRLKMQHFMNANPIFFSDLEKYPSILSFLQNRDLNQRNESIDFYKRGVEQGYFRADINFNLIALVGNAAIRYVMKEQLYKEYSLKDIFANVILFYVRGICTEKGLKELDKRLPNLLEESK